MPKMFVCDNGVQFTSRSCKSFPESLGVEVQYTLIARLDFTYSDKRPIHAIAQEMGTLRQGGLSILQYYDEVTKNYTYKQGPYGY